VGFFLGTQKCKVCKVRFAPYMMNNHWYGAGSMCKQCARQHEFDERAEKKNRRERKRESLEEYRANVRSSTGTKAAASDAPLQPTSSKSSRSHRERDRQALAGVRREAMAAGVPVDKLP
jgi:hypothetical protein